MKKFIVALAVAALCAPAALAVSRDEAASIARDAAGGATVARVERDDGAFEVELRGDGVRYDVDVRAADGAVLEIEAAYTGAGRGESFVLDEAQARAAAAGAAPAAADGRVFAERDEDGCVYEVFYADGNEVGQVTVNAETGAVVRATRWPAAADVLGADEVERRVAERKSGARLTELELSWDDGRYVYEGEAEADGARWSFEMDATSGKVLEFEREGRA